MRNTHKLRKHAEQNGIALMLSGSYVLQSLDSNEWNSMRRTDFKKLTFSEELSIVITNDDQKINNRGKLARLAFLSLDGRFAKYIDPARPNRSAIISLRLINARPYKQKEFLKHIVGNKPIHIERIVNAKEKWFGILFGSLRDCYASLVVVTGSHPGFTFVDIETKQNRYNRMVLSRVLRVPPDGVPKNAKNLRRYGLD